MLQSYPERHAGEWLQLPNEVESDGYVGTICPNDHVGYIIHFEDGETGTCYADDHCPVCGEAWEEHADDQVFKLEDDAVEYAKQYFEVN